MEEVKTLEKMWCRGREANSHVLSETDFKSAASPPRNVVRGHLVCIAHEQAAVGDGGVVPGLA